MNPLVRRCLFILLAVIVSVQSSLVQAHQSGVEALLSEKVRAVAALNKVAKDALIEAASDPVFANYFAAESPDEIVKLKADIDHHAIRVSQAFHADEVCLIDPFGREISRVVDSQIAHDLSHSEKNNVFFKPGFATPPGEVYESPPYISEDAGEWVIGFTTLIMAQGRKRAILHLERGIRHLSPILRDGIDRDGHFIVAIDDDGWIIGDSRKDVSFKGDLAKPFPGAYFERLVLGRLDFRKLVSEISKSAGPIDSGGQAYYVAYQRVGAITLFAFERAE